MNDLSRSSNGVAIDADIVISRLYMHGSISLDCDELRRLRHSQLMSQQELANHCELRRYRISIATIKRAESGRRVRFRVARELARCFDVPVLQIVRATPA